MVAWCCRHLHTLCRRLWVYLAPYACGEEFGIVDDLATSSARHVHCTCAAVICFKMVALPLGISHTRHRPKLTCMMFTHMVYNVRLGVVDISTSCAGVCESILLHMLVAGIFGLLLTLPRPVQGMYKMVALSLAIRHQRHQFKARVMWCSHIWCFRYFQTPCIVSGSLSWFIRFMYFLFCF